MIVRNDRKSRRFIRIYEGADFHINSKSFEWDWGTSQRGSLIQSCVSHYKFFGQEFLGFSPIATMSHNKTFFSERHTLYLFNERKLNF